MHLIAKSSNKIIDSVKDVQNLKVLSVDYPDFSTLSAEDSKSIEAAVVFNKADCTNKTLEACTNIKWLHNTWTGSEGILKAESFKNTKVLVSNTRGVSAIPLTELVVASAIYFTKSFPFFQKNQQNATFKQTSVENVYGKSVLVAGYGTIGKRVGKIFKDAFNSKISVLKRTVTEEDKANLKEVSEFYKISDLKQALADADIVVNALPDTDETKGLYNEEVFKAFKKDSLFINVGRGTAVDEKALVSALKEGHLRGAALDVTCVEPIPADHFLYTEKDIQDKLFLSCHSMDYECKDQEHINDIFHKNLVAYAEGKPLETAVCTDAGY